MEVKPSIYIRHLANLFFGMYQQKFSQEWDSKLVEIIDQGVVSEAGAYTLTVNYQSNTIEIWCSNKWYSFAHAHRVNGVLICSERQYRPRISTMVKLWDIYQVERNKSLDDSYRNLFNSATDGGR